MKILSKFIHSQIFGWLLVLISAIVISLIFSKPYTPVSEYTITADTSPPSPAISANIDKHDINNTALSDDNKAVLSNAPANITGNYYIFSTTSTKLHKPDCVYANNIQPQNKRYISNSDTESALKQGFEFCKKCCGDTNN